MSFSPLLKEKSYYYAVLGVAVTCTQTEVKRAFRVLQRSVHPDAARGDAAAARCQSALLNRAYQTLSSRLRRLEYDLEHGFRERSAEAVSQLQRLRKREAEKQRQNMRALASRSREIEAQVATVTKAGATLFHAGLLVTKARFGALPSKKAKAASKAEDSTIDVTDVIQAMVQHSAADDGGWLQIGDGVDKSQLPGFYFPITEDSVKKHLEIEYMFDRKYHFVRVENSEHICIPAERHLYEVPDEMDDMKDESCIPGILAAVRREQSVQIEDESASFSEVNDELAELLQKYHMDLEARDSVTMLKKTCSMDSSMSSSSDSGEVSDLSSTEIASQRAGMKLSAIPRHSFATNSSCATEPGETSLPIRGSPDVVRLPSGQQALAVLPSLGTRLRRWTGDWTQLPDILGAGSGTKSHSFMTSEMKESSSSSIMEEPIPGISLSARTAHSSGIGRVLVSHRFALLTASLTAGVTGASMWHFYAHVEGEEVDDDWFVMRWANWVLRLIGSASDGFEGEGLSPVTSSSTLATAAVAVVDDFSKTS